jgi:hypothetical protein
MPYVITSKPLGAHKAGTSQHFSRHAVSSLRKARRYVESAVVGVQGYMAWDEPHMGPLTEAGGIVGPLSDGTVLVVERVEWQTLEDSAPGYITERGVLDAYNARQA